MTIAEEIARRTITEVLHFTTNRGLVGMLAQRAVLSRRKLPAEEYLQHVLHENSITRPEQAEDFDKSLDWLDFVNLSLSEINTRFLGFSQNWPHNANLWWSILAFNPRILAHPGVYFATTNNAYEHCRRNEGLAGLQALFVPTVRRKGTWKASRGNRPASLPTCEQAEVLYPGELSLDFLCRIYVVEGPQGDCVRGWLRDFQINNVVVTVAPGKFTGSRN